MDPLHQQIGKVISCAGAVIVHAHRTLLLHRKTAFPQLMGQGVFMHLFHEAGAQSIGDFAGTMDNFFCDLKRALDKYGLSTTVRTVLSRLPDWNK